MTPPAVGGRVPGDAVEIAAEMTKLYDDYYTSCEYGRRYPKPNRTTMDFLYRHGAGSARRILDYGCGNGRYALALLQDTNAQVTGFDISRAAIDEFAGRLKGSPVASRTRLLWGDPAMLDESGRFDLIVCLFGVLSHVGLRDDRIRVLRHMRSLIATHGSLVLTVPNLFRRRPFDLLQAAADRAMGKAPKALKEPGNIVFSRHIANADRRFFYHLYTLKGLQEELLEAGFVLRSASAESLLPEWMITQSPLLGRVDAALAPLLPSCLGYGICVAAAPVGE